MKLLMIICSFSLSSVVFAESMEATTEKLLREMNMKKTLEDSVEQMLVQTYIANPKLKEIEPEYSKLLRELISYKNMKPYYVKIYNRYYNQKEISQLTKFYKTPVGKKSIKVMPQIMGEVIKFTDQLMKKNAHKFDKVIKDAIKKRRKAKI